MKKILLGLCLVLLLCVTAFGETMGEKNALKAARQYLDIMGLSYSGLIRQLELAEFSHEEAVYAADNCGADWNEQAVKAAESLLEIMGLSRKGLIKQLTLAGFTSDQAEYGAKKVGY